MALGDGKATAKQATRVEFTITDRSYPFVEVARADGVAVFLEKMLPRGDGSFAEFFSVSGISPDDVAAIAGEHVVEATVVERYDDGGIVEFVADEDCPAVHLAKHGAMPRDVYGKSGEGRIVIDVPGDVETGALVDRFLDEYPDANLVAKRSDQTSTPTLNRLSFQRLLEDRLTHRQQQALAHAHEAGYYEWPRQTTAADLAADLGVSAPTFHKHLRRAEGKLVAALFESPSVESAVKKSSAD